MEAQAPTQAVLGDAGAFFAVVEVQGSDNVQRSNAAVRFAGTFTRRLAYADLRRSANSVPPSRLHQHPKWPPSPIGHHH